MNSRAARVTSYAAMFLLTATVCSSPAWAQYSSAIFGAARCFNGMDDYVLVQNSPSLNPATAITIEAWINLNDLPSPVTGEYAIVSKWSGPGSGGGRYIFGVISGANIGRLSLTLQNATSVSNQALTPGVWYHVAATYDGSKIKIFINGALDVEVVASSSLGSSSTPLAIGKNIHNNIDGTVGPYFFKGEIDEVRISDIARDPVSFCLSGPCAPDVNTVGLWDMDEVPDSSAYDNMGIMKGTGCSPKCTVVEGDVDCSGNVDIVDVVRTVNVAFRGADPLTEFCHPCP